MSIRKEGLWISKVSDEKINYLLRPYLLRATEEHMFSY
jgi:hypothetical protein